MTGNREAYRCLVASFISISSLLLNSFSSFWRKQKSAIHDLLSCMTQLQTISITCLMSNASSHGIQMSKMLFY